MHSPCPTIFFLFGFLHCKLFLSLYQSGPAVLFAQLDSSNRLRLKLHSMTFLIKIKEQLPRTSSLFEKSGRTSHSSLFFNSKFWLLPFHLVVFLSLRRNPISTGPRLSFSHCVTFARTFSTPHQHLPIRINNTLQVIVPAAPLPVCCHILCPSTHSPCTLLDCSHACCVSRISCIRTVLPSHCTFLNRAVCLLPCSNCQKTSPFGTIKTMSSKFSTCT